MMELRPRKVVRWMAAEFSTHFSDEDETFFLKPLCSPLSVFTTSALFMIGNIVCIQSFTISSLSEADRHHYLPASLMITDLATALIHTQVFYKSIGVIDSVPNVVGRAGQADDVCTRF